MPQPRDFQEMCKFAVEQHWGVCSDEHGVYVETDKGRVFLEGRHSEPETALREVREFLFAALVEAYNPEITRVQKQLADLEAACIALQKQCIALVEDVLKAQTRCSELETEKAELRRAVLAVLNANGISSERDSEGRIVLRLGR